MTSNPQDEERLARRKPDQPVRGQGALVVRHDFRYRREGHLQEQDDRIFMSLVLGHDGILRGTLADGSRTTVVAALDRRTRTWTTTYGRGGQPRIITVAAMDDMQDTCVLPGRTRDDLPPPPGAWALDLRAARGNVLVVVEPSRSTRRAGSVFDHWAEVAPGLELVSTAPRGPATWLRGGMTCDEGPVFVPGRRVTDPSMASADLSTMPNPQDEERLARRSVERGRRRARTRAEPPRLDVEQAEYVGDGTDGAYHGAAQGKDGTWWALVTIDSDTGGFVGDLPAEPYDDEAAARQSAADKAITWCLENGVDMGRSDGDDATANPQDEERLAHRAGTAGTVENAEAAWAADPSLETLAPLEAFARAAGLAPDILRMALRRPMAGMHVRVVRRGADPVQGQVVEVRDGSRVVRTATGDVEVTRVLRSTTVLDPLTWLLKHPGGKRRFARVACPAHAPWGQADPERCIACTEPVCWRCGNQVSYVEHRTRCPERPRENPQDEERLARRAGPTRTFEVRLAASGNPDFGQDDAPLLPTRRVRVRTLREASQVCQDWIQENDLGGGNWTGGQVFLGRRVVAHVSYNGRVWEGPEWHAGRTEVVGEALDRPASQANPQDEERLARRADGHVPSRMMVWGDGMVWRPHLLRVEAAPDGWLRLSKDGEAESGWSIRPGSAVRVDAPEGWTLVVSDPSGRVRFRARRATFDRNDAWGGIANWVSARPMDRPDPGFRSDGMDIVLEPAPSANPQDEERLARRGRTPGGPELDEFKVTFADLEETRDEDDPDDEVHVLRLDVMVRPGDPDAEVDDPYEDEDDEEEGWVRMRAGSVCTSVPVDAPLEEQTRLLDLAVRLLKEARRQGRSLKRQVERLSWMEPGSTAESLRGPSSYGNPQDEERLARRGHPDRMSPDQLREARRLAADRAYEDHDFGPDHVVDSSGWEWTEPGDQWDRTVYVVPALDSEGDSEARTFTVEFEPGTAIVRHASNPQDEERLARRAATRSGRLDLAPGDVIRLGPRAPGPDLASPEVVARHRARPWVVLGVGPLRLFEVVEALDRHGERSFLMEEQEFRDFMWEWGAAAEGESPEDMDLDAAARRFAAQGSDVGTRRVVRSVTAQLLLRPDQPAPDDDADDRSDPKAGWVDADALLPHVRLAERPGPGSRVVVRTDFGHPVVGTVDRGTPGTVVSCGPEKDLVVRLDMEAIRAGAMVVDFSDLSWGWQVFGLAAETSRNPQDEERLARRSGVPASRAPRTPAAELAGDDQCLSQAARDLEDLETPYHDAAAMGLVMRLKERSLGEEIELGRALGRGIVPPAAEIERQWFRAMGPDFARKVESFAMVVADRLRDTAHELAETQDRTPGQWARRLARLLRERDELEGVLILLSDAGYGGALTRVLARLDELAGAMDLGLDQAWERVADEHLLRAAQFDLGNAWWLRPSFGEEDEGEAAPNPQDEERLARRSGRPAPRVASRCRGCRQDIWWDGQSWVDATDGDGCDPVLHQDRSEAHRPMPPPDGPARPARPSLDDVVETRPGSPQSAPGRVRSRSGRICHTCGMLHRFHVRWDDGFTMPCFGKGMEWLGPGRWRIK